MEEQRPLRAIIAKRLSRLTEETTHRTTETETTEDFCRRKNYDVIVSTEDLDVSGGKPIRNRPKIGPWLTLDHLDEWDVLVLYKLDRGFRDHYDFVTFYHEFCDVHGKIIVSVSEDIDMSTRMGRFFAGLLVQFAEWELRTMSERRSAGQIVIRNEARWGGGSFPFGFEPYKENGCWYLRTHPVYQAELVRFAEDAAAHKSVGSIANDLNARGVPTSRDINNVFFGRPVKNYKWTTSTVTQVLRSDAIRGFILYYENDGKGNTKAPVRVTGPDGEYIRREPLIDDKLWYEVQAALDLTTKRQSGVRVRSALLLQVAFCGYCGVPLYKRSASNRYKQKYEYYLCKHADLVAGAPQHCAKSRRVSKPELDDVVIDGLLDAVGSCELTKKTVIQGDDNSQALLKIGMQIADLTKQHYTSGKIPDFHARIAELETEHERISGLPREDAKVRRVSTGQTFSQRWEAMDDEQRHSYLKASGISVMVVRAEDFTDIGLIFTRAADTADDAVLDIPLNIIRTCGNFVVNISIGALAEQLQRASAA